MGTHAHHLGHDQGCKASFPELGLLAGGVAPCNRGRS
jgi:hypothetical protein